MNAIDLTTLAAVKSWANLGNPINTVVASTISIGAQTVTPSNMIGIQPGMQLTVDYGPAQEQVLVTNTTGTTFTAVFANTHSANTSVFGSSDDLDISATITTMSNYFLWRTGRGGLNATPTASPFVSVQTYNEWYDGNGNQQLFLRITPIVTVTQLLINNVTVPQSTSYTLPGWVIDNAAKSLIIRGGGNPRGYYSLYLRGPGYVDGFCRGMQNINVQYTAGYPSVPPDIEMACRQAVASNYNRRNYMDQKSLGTPEGTIQYQNWEFSPFVCQVLDNYSRRAVV